MTEIRITESQYNRLIKPKSRGIIITEQQYNRLCSLITENRESKNINLARKVVKQLSPDADPQKIVDAVRHDIPNSRTNSCKFLPGITRMVLKNELGNQQKIARLNSALKIIGNYHADEFSNDLNGKTADEIINTFSAEVQSEHDSDVKAHNSTKFTENNEYKIYKIDSFEKASKFAKYTTWCVTQTVNAYNSYTNDGTGLFYFCVKDGFESVPKEHGDGCPLDEYGLSMIATSVNAGGSCNTITCRWNHDNGGNDNIMTPMQLSKLIGHNYYEVFKPYSKEELRVKGAILVEDMQALLDSGIEPEEIFDEVIPIKGSDDLYAVYIKDTNMCNVLRESDMKLTLDEWVKSVYNFEFGIGIVDREDGKYNYINTHGELLSDIWFYDVEDFHDGFARVQREDGDWNLINTHGELLSDVWFYYADNFRGGLVKVQREDGKINFINKNGEFLSDLWLNGIGDFRDGLACVQREDKKYNYINTHGELLSDVWFNDIKSFRNGLAEVKTDDGERHYMDTKGNITE